MTNKRTKKEEEAAAQERNNAADEADKAAKAANLNYNSPAELDPNSQASKQRDLVSELGAEFEKRLKWFHDASHSADAERLRAQRARDEEAGMGPKKEDED